MNSAWIMRRSDYIYYILLVPLDFVMLLSAGFAAYFLRLSEPLRALRPVIFSLPVKTYFEIMMMVIPGWLLVFALLGLYKMRKRSFLEEFLQIISASSLAFMVIVLYIFLSHEWFESRFIILIGWLFAIAAVCTGRIIARVVRSRLAAKKSFFVENALAIGDNPLMRSLLGEIETHPSLGYRIVRHMPELNLSETKNMIDRGEVVHVIASTDNLKNGLFSDLMYLCYDKNVQFKFIPSEFQTHTMNFETETLSGIPLISQRKTALDGWGRVGKRIFDFAAALCGIVVLLPVFLVVAIAIKLDSEGPAFARLKRVSAGNTFDLFKFRSMVMGAHKMKKDLMDKNERQDGPLFKMKADPRVTKVGAFIRKWRIDELPQLFNVLAGEMSMAGPRPHEPEEIAKYKLHHKKLLAIKAGITGLAQISGASNLPFEEEVKLDVFYIENWSFFLDIKILLKTFVVVFTDKSAC